MAWLYFIQLALLKASLLFFYLKIFPNKTVRWLLWGTLVFNAICKSNHGDSLLLSSFIWLYWACLQALGPQTPSTITFLFELLLIFTFEGGTLFALLAVFQCKPISYFWYQWDGLHAGTCPIATSTLGWSNGKHTSMALGSTEL